MKHYFGMNIVLMKKYIFLEDRRSDIHFISKRKIYSLFYELSALIINFDTFKVILFFQRQFLLQLIIFESDIVLSPIICR